MDVNTDTNIHKLTEHFFRQESGKMVSVLTRIFGPSNLETAEDVVQQTFLDALSIWKLNGIPENPPAWIFRVAKNKAIDFIRKNKYLMPVDFSIKERVLLNSEYTLAATMENLWKEVVIKDDMMRMMFACCHPSISVENQISLILKILCGFSTSEIAKAFLCPEDTVSKRLYRAKEFFRNERIKLEIPSSTDLGPRTNAVLNSIYLLFNEGYNSTHAEKLIRQDLIDEAMMLCKLLMTNKHTQLPEVFALMALMCFHTARSASRLTPEGDIILLPLQDRKKWDRALIEEGNRYMDIAAFGNQVSSYHLEAAIAYEHCRAESYEKTNWKHILKLYEWLCKIFPSPVAEMNKAVAILQVNGAKEALAAIGLINDQKKIAGFYLYHSLLGDIYFTLKAHALAGKHLRTALQLTQSDAEKKMIKNKIAALHAL